MIDGVKSAWIARKQLAHVQEAPLYVIAVAAAGLFANAGKLITEAAEKVDTQYPTYFVATAGDGAKIGKKVAKTGTRLV